MTYKLNIERWHPATVNKLMGHWRTAGRLKRVDKNMIGFYCKANRIPIAQGAREVALTITISGPGRPPDPDAFWKSTLDALVQAEMLIDDSMRFVRHGPVNIVRGPERATLITLTDL